VSLTSRRMNGLNSRKIQERVGEKLLAELQRERRAQAEGSERYKRLAKDTIATPRNGLRVELVVPPDRRAFDCADFRWEPCEADHLPLVELVSVLDEAEALLREDLPAEGC
jgi:hypothetical protein